MGKKRNPLPIFEGARIAGWESVNEHPYANGTPPSVQQPTRLPMIEDSIEGGKGDKLEPEDVDPFELEMGIRVELEHVDAEALETGEESEKEALAQEIALDHLAEDGNEEYYTDLYVKGIADEPIDDILAKWEDKEETRDRVEKIRKALTANEDFISHVNDLLADPEFSNNMETNGYTFDGNNSGVKKMNDKPFLAIIDIDINPEMFESPEEAVSTIAGNIKSKLAFDPNEFDMDGNDVRFPLKENEI